MFKRLNLPEGLPMLKWAKKRFECNQNILVSVIGPTGSGKSYTCLRFLELWYPYYFNKPMPIEHICFSIRDVMKLIMSGKLVRGDIIVLEEAGVLMNSLDFQNKFIKFFGFVLQSFRSKNIGIIFNLPHLKFMTKTARSLLHATLQTFKLDRHNEEIELKFKFRDVDAMTGKEYNKYLKHYDGGRKIKLRRIYFKKPAKEIVEVYEKNKGEFVDKVSNSLMAEYDKQDEKENPKEKENIDSERLKVLMERAWLKGARDLKTMAPLIGISAAALSKRNGSMVLMDLQDKYNETPPPKNKKSYSANRISPLNVVDKEKIPEIAHISYSANRITPIDAGSRLEILKNEKKFEKVEGDG